MLLWCSHLAFWCLARAGAQSFEQGQRMACAGKPQGRISKMMGTREGKGREGKGRETARSSSDLPPPPLKAIMCSLSEGL